MPAGGRRPGAGRKPGSATRRTREIAERAAAQGLTPLEVLLGVMRTPEPQGARADVLAAWRAQRIDAAKAAAPYLHPRLAPVSMKIAFPGLEGPLVEQGTATLRALGRGEIAPDIAVMVLQGLASQAKLVETDELARRVAEIERKIGVQD